MEEKKKRWRPSLGAYRSLENEVSSLRVDNESLRRSNGYMEKEMKRLRESARNGELRVTELEREVTYLRGRGFWKRVFNK